MTSWWKPVGGKSILTTLVRAKIAALLIFCLFVIIFLAAIFYQFPMKEVAVAVLGLLALFFLLSDEIWQLVQPRL